MACSVSILRNVACWPGATGVPPSAATKASHCIVQVGWMSSWNSRTAVWRRSGSSARRYRFSRPRSSFDHWEIMSDSAFVPLMPLADIPGGSMQSRILDSREIVICHTREGLFALDNICTLALARLCEGSLRATRLICPLHGASFDVRDGRVLGAPATIPLATRPVRVVAGPVEVAV